ncbi:MAG: HAD family phosphatase [Thermoproteota archaeon]|nr:HAD family phosphatase [Thermoproteota archaeon]
MKGILFDMDGVLIDAMPFHAEAFQIAFREIAKIDIDKKDVFLLEGMPGHELVKEIFKKMKKGVPEKSVIESISERKKSLFKLKEKARSFEGVKELLESLNDKECIKAVVSGASENEVNSLLKKNGILDSFDLVISGEDLAEGKPSPEPFVTALKKLGLKPEEALVVENSPLGVNSAVRAHIPFIVTLNNTPVTLDEFQNLPKDKEELAKILFKDTNAATNYIINWCCSS